MPGSNAESAFTYVPTVEGPNHIKCTLQYTHPDRLVASLLLTTRAVITIALSMKDGTVEGATHI